jgi:HlyD family secretion protein
MTVREYIAEEAKTRLAKEYLLSAPVAGTALRIELEPGDLVEAGQVVAKIDPFPIEQQIKALDARIAQAKAQTIGVDKAKPKPEDLEKRQPCARNRWGRGASRPRARDEAQRRRRRGPEGSFDRAKGLLEKGVVSQSEFDMAQSRRDAASRPSRAQTPPPAPRRRVFASAISMRSASRVPSTTTNTSARSTPPRPRPSPRSSMRSERSRQDRSARARRRAGAREVPSRRARRHAPGTPLLKIGDLATLEIESDVLSEEVGRIREGAQVELLGKAFGGAERMGAVKRIYPSAFMKISALGVEQQRVKVLIGLEPAKDGPALRPGTRLDVHIITGEKQNALAVPERAAFRRQGQWYVFKVENGTAKLAPVTLGLKNDHLRGNHRRPRRGRHHHHRAHERTRRRLPRHPPRDRPVAQVSHCGNLRASAGMKGYNGTNWKH